MSGQENKTFVAQINDKVDITSTTIKGNYSSFNTDVSYNSSNENSNLTMNKHGKYI